MALPALTLGHETKPFDGNMLCKCGMKAMPLSRTWRNCVLSFCKRHPDCSTGVAEQALLGLLGISAQVRSRIRQKLTVFVILAEDT